MLIQTLQSCFRVHLHVRLTLLPEMPFLDCSWDVLLWTSELENLQCRLLYFVRMKFNFNFIWRKRAQVQGAKSSKRCRWSAKTVLKKLKNSHGFRHCCETAHNSVWHHFSSKHPPSVFAELGTDSLTLGDKFMVRNLLNVRESKTSALIHSLWARTLWCFPEKTSCLVSNSFQLQWSFIWAASVSFIWQRKLCLISTQVQDHRVKKAKIKQKNLQSIFILQPNRKRCRFTQRGKTKSAKFKSCMIYLILFIIY